MVDRLQLLLDYQKEDPDDPFTSFALAQEYLKRDDLTTARSYLEQLVVASPDYIGTYYHLGKLYERLELVPEAVRIYEKGIDAARAQREFHALSELQSALQKVKGLDWDDE